MKGRRDAQDQQRRCDDGNRSDSKRDRERLQDAALLALKMQRGALVQGM